MTECISDDELLQLWDDAEQVAIAKHRPSREMSLKEKFFAGPRMLETACEYMSQFLRGRFPDSDAAEISTMLKQIVDRHRVLEPKSPP
jgi:hypothetical protein